MTIPSQVVSFHLGTRDIKEIPWATFQVNPQDAQELYWIHLGDLQPATLQEASQKLSLPESLMTELMSPESIPDVDETEDSLTLIAHYWKPSFSTEEEMEPRRLILYLTERFCLTVATDPIPALEHFLRTYRREFRFAKTSNFMLFLILDYLVDDFTRTLRRLDHASEAIDNKIHDHFEEHLNSEVIALKRQIITLKGFIGALRDILMRLSGRRIPIISEECRSSLGDVNNHAQVLMNQLESLRDLVASSLEAYNSVLAHRMNDTMKILTMFASIILPMSLIAGIYGMNFQHMPELVWKYGYGFALALMVCCGVSLLFLFKKKKWF